MKLINEEIVQQITEIFDQQLVHPVEIIYFFKYDHCASCNEAHQLLDEISSISDKLYLSTYDIDQNSKLAKQYKMDLMPGFALVGREGDKILDYGIRFAGMPSGYEFSSLIQSIILVSKRDSGLKPDIRNELKGLSKPINLKVFVTPT